jgi:sigma-B regulation protein RsbU (phosphoserine phosphatase)
MLLADAQLSASEVLRTFHHDEPNLFLGAAFTTVGIVSAGFCLIRRRADALLISLAVFAYLYGQRLWLQSDLLRLTVPPSELFHRLRAAVSLLIPVPGFIFFQVAGLLPKRGKIFTVTLVGIFLGLTIATLAFGPKQAFHTTNNLLVIIALLSMVVYSLRQGSADRDYVVLRRGLLCFVAFALWDNTAASYLRTREIEPYGFAVFLACMGYVAARRTLERDQQFGELQKELEVARNIQLSILPGQFPTSTPFHVAAKYVPMTAVAGDLYDFLLTDSSSAGLLIADVSGHGVPAALIASMVKMAATSQRAHAAHPALLLAGMNAALCGNTQGQFVTAAYVHLDALTRELRYAAAGHPSMFLLRDGIVTEVVENGLLLAATDTATYTERSMQIQPGDRLMLYTDGLLEAKNREGRLFGEDALYAAMRKTGGLAPAEAASHIIAEVQQWAKSQDDDLTVLICDYLGMGAPSLVSAD